VNYAYREGDLSLNLLIGIQLFTTLNPPKKLPKPFGIEVKLLVTGSYHLQSCERYTPTSSNHQTHNRKPPFRV
jgi:hypothetical protein